MEIEMCLEIEPGKILRSIKKFNTGYDYCIKEPFETDWVIWTLVDIQHYDKSADYIFVDESSGDQISYTTFELSQAVKDKQFAEVK